MQTRQSSQADSFRHMNSVIANEYGYNPQSRQLIEEMAELTQAVNKFWRKDLECGKVEFSKELASGERYENIVEEIADVEILLDQMKLFLGIDAQEIDGVKGEKLKRQIERIQGAGERNGG